MKNKKNGGWRYLAIAWIWAVVLAFYATNFLANPKYVSFARKLLGI